MNSKNFEESTEHFVFHENACPVEAIAATKDVELLNHIIFSFVASTFLSHECANFVVLLKEDSSILINISKSARRGIIDIANSHFN